MAAKKKASASDKPKKPKKKAGDKSPPTRGKRKPAPAGSAGLDASAVAALSDGDADTLAAHIVKDGGAVLARYKDPLFGKAVVFAALPVEKVERTSFQRDVSEPHVDRLVDAIKRTGAYLDPVICVRNDDGKYRSPNGGHRLAALTRLGARTITALVVPDAKLAFKILALNTEKAHALKEKALEAVRMLRALAPYGGHEADFAGELEEPNLATLGAAYEKRPRLSGSAYNPLLKRSDAWLEVKIDDAPAERERRAARLLALDDLVTPIVEKLRAKGFDSPGLRSMVMSRVARLPPRGVKLTGTFDEIWDKAIAKAQAFDPESIALDDVAAGGGAGGDDS